MALCFKNRSTARLLRRRLLTERFDGLSRISTLKAVNVSETLSGYGNCLLKRRYGHLGKEERNNRYIYIYLFSLSFLATLAMFLATLATLSTLPRFPPLGVWP